MNVCRYENLVTTDTTNFRKRKTKRVLLITCSQKKGANAPVKVIDRFPQLNQHHTLLHLE